ncbi:MAG TPA: hypothetical protein VHY08_04185 [Bacillota bacterium]|nr:hypothetical protein [Bacillota bacterium]
MTREDRTQHQRRNKPLYILLAGHDDGLGAFSIMSRFAHALLKQAGAQGLSLRLIFYCQKSRTQFRYFGLDLPQIGLLPNEVTIKLPKDPGANAVAAPEILKLLHELAVIIPKAGELNWEKIQWFGPDPDFHGWPDLTLAVSMGVPFIHPAARGAGVKSLEIGDMCFSLVLRGCLAEAGLRTPYVEGVLDTIATAEQMASEVWLLPIAAPVEYETYFGSAGIPVHRMPGIFGTQDHQEKEHTEDLARQLKIKTGNRPIVGIHAGATHVWDGAIRTIARRPPGLSPAIIELKNDQIYLLENDCSVPIIELPVLPSKVPLFKNQLFGITRGGITVLDHIAARCPVAIAEEPCHWLSLRQRQQAIQSGLCIPVSLEEFRHNPEEVIQGLLRQEKELGAVREKMNKIKVGVEEELAEKVLSFEF